MSTFTKIDSNVYILENKPQIPESLLWNLLESLPLNITIWEEGKVVYANSSFYTTFGVEQGNIFMLNELVENEGYVKIHPDDFNYVPENTQKLKKEIHNGIVFHKELRMKSHCEDDYKWYNTYVVTGKDPENLVTIEIDENIDEKKKANAALEEALREKEILLKEVHHRVKNNFQVISSLLRIQGKKAVNNEVETVLNESYSRVMLMSMIHEKLYRSSDLANVNFTEHIRDLVSNLSELYLNKVRVKFDLQLQKIHLGVDNAIPCSMIINELVSNSFKYAFKNTAEPKITIMLSNGGPDVKLIVKDNGCGLPDDFENRSKGSIGHMIVKTLAGQMNGNVEFKNNNGTEVTVKFKKEVL